MTTIDSKIEKLKKMVKDSNIFDELLNSGCIITKPERTSQTDLSNVYMIGYHGKDSRIGRYVILGYIQIGNTNINAIINNKSMHVFDIGLYTKDMEKLAYKW